MAVTRRLRYEILRRDSHTCRYCGATAPDAKLTVDHVRPVALGGTDDPSNLVAACSDCNSGKAAAMPNEPLIADVVANSARWDQAKAAVAEGQRANAYVGFDGELARFEAECYEHGLPKDGEWRTSVRVWLLRGLPIQQILDLVPVAANKQIPHTDSWRYFCGCVWRSVTRHEEAVRQEYERLQVAEQEADEERRRAWYIDAYGPLIAAFITARPHLVAGVLADLCDSAVYTATVLFQRRLSGEFNEEGTALWMQDETIQIDVRTVAHKMAEIVPTLDSELTEVDMARAVGVGAWRALHQPLEVS